MPDVTITISTPVLTGADYFKIRYRPVGGVYIIHANQTNAPFSLIGLAIGKYELEVIMVKDGVECPAVIHTFQVVAEYSCQIFTPVIVQNGSLFNLQISYGAITTPPCGWQVKLTGVSNNKIINYASFPASPLLIPVVNEVMQVQVIANLCNNKVLECLNTDVPAITPTCTPMVIGAVTATYNQTYANGDYGISINFPFTQSTPVTQFITCIINQINATSGPNGQTSYPNFTLGPITPGNSVSVPIYTNKNVIGSLLEYTWLIVDGCNQQHTGTVSLFL